MVPIFQFPNFFLNQVRESGTIKALSISTLKQSGRTFEKDYIHISKKSYQQWTNRPKYCLKLQKCLTQQQLEIASLHWSETYFKACLWWETQILCSIRDKLSPSCDWRILFGLFRFQINVKRPRWFAFNDKLLDHNINFDNIHHFMDQTALK